MHLNEVFPDDVTTVYYDSINSHNIEEAIDDAIANGCNVIFTTSPTFSQASLKAAIANPKITILNCSLHDPHTSMRTYYARMHEAKFIMGAVAVQWQRMTKLYTLPIILYTEQLPILTHLHRV